MTSCVGNTAVGPHAGPWGRDLSCSGRPRSSPRSSRTSTKHPFVSEPPSLNGQASSPRGLPTTPRIPPNSGRIHIGKSISALFRKKKKHHVRPRSDEAPGIGRKVVVIAVSSVSARGATCLLILDLFVPVSYLQSQTCVGYARTLFWA